MSNRAAKLALVGQTMETVEKDFPFPEKAPADFIDSFYNPRREDEDRAVIGIDGG